MWKEIPPFSFSAGERKIMAHFVVNTLSHRTRKPLNFIIEFEIACPVPLLKLF